MSLLIACATSWVALLAAFAAVWQASAQPRSAAEVLALCVIGAVALLFSRIGLVSALALIVRLIPAGRLRDRIARPLLRFVPLLLRSSVLAAISAGLVAQSAHSAPLPAPPPVVSAQTSATLPSPRWPTTPEGAQRPSPESLDPAWPTTPPADENPGGSPEEPDRPPGETPDTPPEGTPRDDPGDVTVHIVAPGETLWSIAAAHTTGSTADLVGDIHAANRETIGPDPNLIMPGQRLEIDP